MGRRKKVRTEPVRPICPQCEKQFSNQSALTKHKLTHSDERKFACQQCSKAFKRHDHLTGHMQTHSNRKPFNCNIQGCDKTYCDARSLRRHKENIHHIVTLKDNNTQNTDQNNNNNNSTYDTSSQHPNGAMPSPSLPNGTTMVQQPSHLLSRRIQRLQQQQHAYSADYASAPHFSFDFSNPPVAANSDQQFCQNGSIPHSADSINDSSLGLSTQYEQIAPNSAPYDQSQGCSGFVTPSTNHYNNHHQHQQHAYSADYASTQHFSFDFRNPPVTTTSDQQFCQNGSMPHSADSINDSSLGLSTHYEQITPNSAHHDQYQRCGGYITHTTLHPMDHDITQSQNHGQVYQVKHE